MNPVPREVVGVVGDLREVGPETPPHPEAYLPYPQIFFGSAHLVVHTAGDPRAMAGEVRRVIRAWIASLPLGSAVTLEQLAAARVANPATDARILAAFAATGLILAIIGVYGVTSFAVVAAAAGARRPHRPRRSAPRRHPDDPAREPARWIVLGLLLGLSGGALLSRLLASLLFEVSPLDPWTFARHAAPPAGRGPLGRLRAGPQGRARSILCGPSTRAEHQKTFHSRKPPCVTNSFNPKSLQP